MKKLLRIGLGVVCIGIFSFALLGCDLLASSTLVGTWVKADGLQRYVFYSDGSYDEDDRTSTSSSWDSLSYGTYTYNTIQQDLVLEDVMNGNAVARDIIINTAANRMALGVDALSGGETSTLIGSWVGGSTVDSVTTEVQWIFNSDGTISHTNLLGNTANGNFIIDTTATEFEVTNSSAPGVLATGGYKYIVIGDGITISEAGDAAVDKYYDKQ